MGQTIIDPLSLVPADQQELLVAEKTKSDELSLAFAKCFNTPSGRVVIENLRGLTVEQPTWVPDLGEKHAYAREGQNSVYRHILQMIEKSKNINK